MSVPGAYLYSRLRHVVRPPLLAYSRFVLDEVLAALPDASIVADAWEAREYKRLAAEPEKDRLGDPEKLARDSASYLRSELLGVRQGVCNLFAAGLFHLFEQQLAQLWEEDSLDVLKPEATPGRHGRSDASRLWVYIEASAVLE